MQAYLNDPQLKKDFVKEIRKHRKQDQIEQGHYGKENGDWKGCAVACSLRSLAIIKGEDLVEEYNQHERYETDLGIPEWLARLEDNIFEGLPQEEALLWPEKFAQAVRVGSDLEPVRWKFCAYLMKENIERVLELDIEDELKKEVADAIRQVLAVHENAIKTGEWDEEAAESAWSAASAAESAAWSALSAAESAAWSAASAAWNAVRSAAESAESAVRSAESSAVSATWSAAVSAENAAWWSAVRSEAYQKHAKKLLALLRKAK